MSVTSKQQENGKHFLIAESVELYLLFIQNP